MGKWSFTGKLVFTVILAVSALNVFQSILLYRNESEIQALKLQVQFAEQRAIEAQIDRFIDGQNFRFMYGTPAEGMGAGITVSGFAMVDRIDERNGELTIIIPLPPQIPHKIESNGF